MEQQSQFTINMWRNNDWKPKNSKSKPISSLDKVQYWIKRLLAHMV